MTAITPQMASRMKRDNEMVSLESLAQLTGFPLETIKEEVLADANCESGEISMGELREAMSRFLSAELLNE